MKKFIKIIIIIAIINIIIIPVQAAETTPSSEIRSKLEELKKEIASKAAKLKQEISHKLKDKAYVGKVKSKSDTTLTLAAQSGPKMVSINQDTVFESNIKSKIKFSQKNISLEDYIVALGDADETGVLTARKIILLPAPTASPKTYLWGKIISISDKLITLKDKGLKNVAAILPANSDISLNDFVILTGLKNKNDLFNAGFVYVIPQGSAVLKPKKTATPSARLDATIKPQRSQTATPSAKPASKKAS